MGLDDDEVTWELVSCVHTPVVIRPRELRLQASVSSVKGRAAPITRLVAGLGSAANAGELIDDSNRCGRNCCWDQRSLVRRTLESSDYRRHKRGGNSPSVPHRKSSASLIMSCDYCMWPRSCATTSNMPSGHSAFLFMTFVYEDLVEYLSSGRSEHFSAHTCTRLAYDALNGNRTSRLRRPTICFEAKYNNRTYFMCSCNRNNPVVG